MINVNIIFTKIIAIYLAILNFFAGFVGYTTISKEDYAALTAQVQELQERVDASEERAAALDVIINNLNKELDEKNAKLKENDEYFMMYNDERAEMTDEIIRLEGVIADLETDHNAIQEDNALLKEQIADYKEHLAELNDNYTALGTSYKVLEEEYGEMTQAYERTDGMLYDALQELGEKCKEYDDLKDAIGYKENMFVLTYVKDYNDDDLVNYIPNASPDNINEETYQNVWTIVVARFGLSNLTDVVLTGYEWYGDNKYVCTDGRNCTFMFEYETLTETYNARVLIPCTLDNIAAWVGHTNNSIIFNDDEVAEYNALYTTNTEAIYG